MNNTCWKKYPFIGLKGKNNYILIKSKVHWFYVFIIIIIFFLTSRVCLLLVDSLNTVRAIYLQNGTWQDISQ